MASRNDLATACALLLRSVQLALAATLRIIEVSAGLLARLLARR
jgi:hypothetical protein